jgi:hypothetical protein
VRIGASQSGQLRSVSFRRNEARRIASNIAKLPKLLGKALPDDADDAVNNLSDERHDAEDTTPDAGIGLNTPRWGLCRMEQK